MVQKGGEKMNRKIVSASMIVLLMLKSMALFIKATD